MRPPSSSSSQNQQKPYTRARDNPMFAGMTKRSASGLSRAPVFDLQGKSTKSDISRSSSDIGDRQPRKILTDISESVTNSPRDSTSDIILEPVGRSSSGRWSKIDKTTSLPFASIQSDLSIDFEDKIQLSSPKGKVGNEEGYTLTSFTMPASERRSFSVNKRSNLSRISLPPSAASFYNGYSPRMEIVELCESVNRLNLYLKARRDDVSAGVPGKFLHAVMGQDVCDIGSVASTILYAFYLNETLNNEQLCTVPVINMKRQDLNSHAELKWLLISCNIDHSSLVFVDEIDLSYYDLFGSLKLVLLNDSKLLAKQEALKDSLVEIFSCKKADLPVYPWVDKVTVTEDCSCCTVIAEIFALASPEILIGRGFSRLLLAGILLDTGNLTNPNCTSKDKYMATLLINGAGRFGCNGLYQILRYKMYDVSDLKVGEILRKDFKKWTRIGKPESYGSRVMVSHVGMSSIGISVDQLLAHENTSSREIRNFQQLEKLRLLMIVSGYYDSQKNFKREILVSAESPELMKNLLHFFDLNVSQLPLKVLSQPGLGDGMRVFEIDEVTSRKTIERLLEEFGGASKR